MTIQKDTSTVIIRYSKYKDKNLIEEINHVIRHSGHCWMLKIGRMIPIEKLELVVNKSKFVLLKAPKSEGGNFFIACVDECHNGKPTENMIYPDYYDEMEDYLFDFSLEGTWLRINKLVELDFNDVNKFLLKSNGKKAIDVISKTRTSVIYVINAETVTI